MVQFDSGRLAAFCRDNGIVRLRMFGSAARGDERPDSDVDLIADFGSPVGFFELIRAEDELASFFGRPVDLLTEGAISPFMRDTVFESAQTIFEGAGLCAVAKGQLSCDLALAEGHIGPFRPGHPPPDVTLT